MAKDPFESMPILEPEDEPIHTNGFAEPTKETPAEIVASAPPRTLLKTVSTVAVPLFVGAAALWLFFTPDNPYAGKMVATEEITVNSEQQTAETAAMYKAAKSDAEKPKPVVVPVMPGMASSVPAAGQVAQAGAGQGAASAPIPPGVGAGQRVGYSPAGAASASPEYGATATPAYGTQGYPAVPGQMPPPMSEEAAKAAQDRIDAQVKRLEEIRGAPLEVGSVKLMGQSGSSESTKAPGAVADLQADIAREKELAVREQQALQDQVLASMTPKEGLKSKGANEDFLANAAASTATRGPVSALQSPAGRYLVGEGSVIRAVLLTRVNSDLPGRILAKITSDVYDSTLSQVVIPKGSLINGVYNSQVIIGQERLLMAMTRLTLPNGNWIALSGNGATDMMGTSGVQAEVNNHFMKMFGSSLIVGASTLLLPRADTSVTALPGAGAGAGGGVATAGSIFATTLNDVLKTLLDRNKNIAPTLKLEAGEEFMFTANQDMLMAPYR